MMFLMKAIVIVGGLESKRLEERVKIVCCSGLELLCCADEIGIEADEEQTYTPFRPHRVASRLRLSLRISLSPARLGLLSGQCHTLKMRLTTLST